MYKQSLVFSSVTSISCFLELPVRRFRTKKAWCKHLVFDLTKSKQSSVVTKTPEVGYNLLGKSDRYQGPCCYQGLNKRAHFSIMVLFCNTSKSVRFRLLQNNKNKCFRTFLLTKHITLLGTSYFFLSFFLYFYL